MYVSDLNQRLPLGKGAVEAGEPRLRNCINDRPKGETIDYCTLNSS